MLDDSASEFNDGNIESMAISSNDEQTGGGESLTSNASMTGSTQLASADISKLSVTGQIEAAPPAASKQGPRRKKFKCDHDGCDFACSTSSDLKRHSHVHTGERPYICSFCNKSFSQRSWLTAHESMHSGLKPYKCDQCDYASYYRYGLKRHALSHKTDDTSTSLSDHRDPCDDASCDSAGLKRRASTRKPQYIHKCKICQYACRSSTQMKTHEIWHTGLKPYKCNECNYATNNKSSLVRHSKIHAMENPFKCEICPYACRTSSQLTIHEQRAHIGEMPYKCQLCNYTCYTKENLACHENEKHATSLDAVRDESMPSSNDNQEQTEGSQTSEIMLDYSASECNDGNIKSLAISSNDEQTGGEESLTSNASMTGSTQVVSADISKLSVTGPIQATPPAASKQGWRPKKFKCDYDGCHFACATSSHLKRHSHVHTGERPYPCSFCNKSFSQQSWRNVHELMHSGLKPYKCDQCDFASCHSNGLKRHMLKHKFKCKYCPFTSTNSTSLSDHRDTCPQRNKFKCANDGCKFAGHSLAELKRHSYVHTGERPYICSFCNKSFNSKSSLTAHEVMHSGLKPYKCGQCDYASFFRSSLKTHALTHKTEYPYNCKICSYGCRSSIQMKTHEDWHTGLKSHKCNQCSYATNNRSSLLRHSRIHAMENPFKCVICPYACRTSTQLSIHEQLAHPKEMPYKCQSCDYSCSSKENLTTHVNEKHSTSPSHVYNLRSRSRFAFQEQDKTHDDDAVQRSDSEGDQPNEEDEQGGPTMAIKIESGLPKLSLELVKTEYGVEEEDEDEPMMAIKIKSEMIEDVSEHSDGDEIMTIVNGSQEEGEQSSTSIPSMPSGSTQLISADKSELTQLLQPTQPATKKRRVEGASRSTLSTTKSLETLVSAAIASGDIHTCGACKAQFLDLYLFMKHKQQECSVVADPIVLQKQQYDHHSASISSAMSDPTQVVLAHITKTPVTEPSQTTLPFHAFSDELFECHLEPPTDSPLPSHVLRLDEPTTSSIIMDSEPPNVTPELVKVEFGAEDEITPRGNDRQEQTERFQTSSILTEIKVEPEWEFS